MIASTWSGGEIEEKSQEEDEEISRNFVAFSRQIDEDHESKSEETKIAIDDDTIWNNQKRHILNCIRNGKLPLKQIVLSAQTKVSEQNWVSYKSKCKELEIKLAEEELKLKEFQSQVDGKDNLLLESLSCEAW